MSPLCCHRCGVPVINHHCQCPNLHPNIIRAVSPLPYTQWVATAIKRTKYEDESSRAFHLAEFLQSSIEQLGAVDGLIPVPLHTRKLRDRGYNQSALLAQHVGASLSLPVLPMLQRHRETQAQALLSRASRTTNVAEAFSVAPGFSPRLEGTFVLVDDVRTTGATLNACVSALADVGVTKVHAATVAVDLNSDQLEWLSSMGMIVVT